MQYLHLHVDSREDPTRLLPGARSVIVVALSYNQPGPGGSDNPGLTGRVSRYAWGRDYHRLVKNKLLVIADRIRAEIDSAIETKVCVDTGANHGTRPGRRGGGRLDRQEHNGGQSRAREFLLSWERS